MDATAPPRCGEMIRRIITGRWRRNFVLPNYTPGGWWECDVFEVTAAGYFREYEVKTSRADFRADAGKARAGWVTEEVPPEERLTCPWNTTRRVRRPRVTKHELLAAGNPEGPSRFWYVVPEGLIVPADLPPWAGLIECYLTRLGSVCEREVRPAPKLHGEKPAPAVTAHARGICYWRMHDLMPHRGASDEADDYRI